jgi:hypothetical protein
MKSMFTPIDVESITRNALRGHGHGDAEPVVKRYRWLLRQPTERRKSTPVARRSRASARSVPSSAR